jgi:hypothetical protein
MRNTIPDNNPVSEETKADPRVKLCEGTCGRWTRLARMKAADFPGTVVRANMTHCNRCVNADRRVVGELVQKPNVAEDRLAHTLTGLQQFMARREARKSRGSLAGIEQFSRGRVAR